MFFKFKKLKKLIKFYYSKLGKPLKIFLVALVIGIQLALLISYCYSIYKNKIFAGEGIRDTLTYQGKITNADGVPPPDGQYNMRFKIYDQATNGTLLWTEIWDSTNQGVAGSKVTVTEGVFNVELNSLCGNWVGDCASNGGVTFAQDSFYLQVELDYDGNGTYEEIFTPRKRFTATPYSMNTDKLDGYDSGDFVLKSGSEMTGSLTAPQFIDSSLLAYYQFNGDADDSSANTLDGILQNSADVSNDVLELDGVDQYVSVSDDDLLSFGNGTVDSAFTVSGWIKMTDATNFNIISKGIYNTDGEYLFYIDNTDKIRIRLNDESVTDCYIGRLYDTALTDYEGSWINLAATYDGSGASSGLKIYLNGNQVDNANNESNYSSYVAMENLTSNLYIGKYASTYSKGKIDDLKLYNRELSADEIKRLFESEARSQLHSNKITTKDVYFEKNEEGETEGGYLTWDNINNRFKFSSELYSPNSLPYFNNSIGDRDYAYLADDNKVLAYDFHESVGATVSDLEGNSNGTLNGDADWTNLGYIGYGLKFDDDSDYISFADPGLSSTQGTVEMWVKLNDVTTSDTNYLLRMWSGASNEIAIYKQNAADLYVEAGDSSAIDTGWDFPDTSWHHIVLSWDSTAIDVYVDSVDLSLTDTYTSLDVSLFSNFYLGSDSAASTALNGIMDSVALYDDVLTATEIANHYNAAFNNLYLINNLNDGNISATLADFYSFSATVNGRREKKDPVYYNDDTRTLALGFSEGYGSSTASQVNSLSAGINGASWTRQGYYGYGLEFDGSDDYLLVEDNDYIDIDTEDFSIEFWVKGDDNISQSGNRILEKVSGSTGFRVYYTTDDRITFAIGDGTNSVAGSPSSGGDMSKGQWEHMILTFDRDGDATIYNDGNEVYSVDISSVTGSLSNDSDLYIGKDASGNLFKGKLDSIIIYKNQLLNSFDGYSRSTNSQEFFINNTRTASTGQAALGGINQSSGGWGGVFYIANTDNTSGYPLSVWNEASYTSGSDTVYNLISFMYQAGQSSFGNLIWDSTNSQFVFDQSIKTNGDLTADYIKTVGSDTSDNEFLAHDVIRHTLTSTDITNRYFTEAWSKATTKKVVNIHTVTVDESDANDKLTTDDWTNSGATDNGSAYDGTNITITDQNNAWEENDIVTIYIVYEK